MVRNAFSIVNACQAGAFSILRDELPNGQQTGNGHQKKSDPTGHMNNTRADVGSHDLWISGQPNYKPQDDRRQQSVEHRRQNEKLDGINSGYAGDRAADDGRADDDIKPFSVAELPA